jgi:para-aminobenzoate synthetase component 1
VLDAVEELLEERPSGSAALAVGVDEEIAHPANPRPVARADIQGAAEAHGLADIVDGHEHVGMVKDVLQVGPPRDARPRNRLLGALEDLGQRRQVLGDGSANLESTLWRHGWMLARRSTPPGTVAAIATSPPYHPAVIPMSSTGAPLRLRRLPDRVASARAIDVAEAFRDLPGLALLESARPGRNARWTHLTADPVAVLESPAAGPDPFAVARHLVERLDRTPVVPADAPPFLGGLVGFLGYDLGATLERLPAIARPDQDLPLLRLALHDWVVAWDRRTGHAWLAGRALDGDGRRLARRLDDVHARLMAARMVDRAASHEGARLQFRSAMDRSTYEARVERIREHIALGDIYQANLTRRLAAGFDGDPWPLYRHLRTGDPSLFSAYLDLGPGQLTGRPRALLSASPEPFLSVDQAGVVTSDPIKGTRPRGRDRAEDRALACELLASAKDRAENVMIVDVLRNDLGRVCRPGSVRVPRLCRLERTATVQHLVSTVTGRLAPGRDAFDLLAASFPGGSITGAPKIRAMEILEQLEPVRRGPYTGALGWIGPDGAMQASIVIRTFVADGRQLTLHVGGGITWKSDPAAEWDETVAKARGPLSAIGATEVA